MRNKRFHGGFLANIRFGGMSALPLIVHANTDGEQSGSNAASDVQFVTDDNGHIKVSDNGLPLFRRGEGEPVELDVASYFTQIKKLNEESKNRRLEAEQLKKELEAFKPFQELSESDDGFGVDKVLEWKNAAENMDADVKAQLKQQQEAAQRELTELETKMTTKVAELSKQLEQAQKSNFELVLSQQLAYSQFIKTKTVWSDLPPNEAAMHAMTYFKDSFKYEKEDGGMLRPVAYYPDGTKIYADKNPAEPAGVDEALSKLAQQHWAKGQILKDTRPLSQKSNAADVASRNNLTAEEFSRLSATQRLQLQRKSISSGRAA